MKQQWQEMLRWIVEAGADGIAYRDTNRNHLRALLSRKLVCVVPQEAPSEDYPSGRFHRVVATEAGKARARRLP